MQYEEKVKEAFYEELANLLSRILIDSGSSWTTWHVSVRFTLHGTPTGTMQVAGSVMPSLRTPPSLMSWSVRDLSYAKARPSWLRKKERERNL